MNDIRGTFANGAGLSRIDAPSPRYDVIVVGGGIYGASLAWECASRGLTVVLIEQADFGSGTSANSLKVIHGGIRYLQNLDVLRTRQSIREMRAMLRIAPHLVRPMQCVMPTYRQLGKSKTALWLGTKFYDLIARDRNQGLDQARRLGRSETLSLSELRSIVPTLADDEVTGGACWWDAQAHNSERLVLAFIMSARAKGAHTFNYMRVREHILERGRARGVIAENILTGQNAEIIGSVIMDCTGPWVGKDRRHQPAFADKGTTFATAMNLIVRRKFSRCAMGLRTSSERSLHGNARLLFFAPWRDGTIIGTWYHQAECAPDTLATDSDTVQGAIDQVNDTLPEANLRLNEITSIHLGQLPAWPAPDSASEPRLCSNFAIVDGSHHGAHGLFWIQGVKYTTARDVVHRAVCRATKNMDKHLGPSVSHVDRLYGGDISDIAPFWRSRLNRHGNRFDEGTISRLLDNYGTVADVIIALADRNPSLSAPVPGAKHVLRAELAYILNQEMPHTLSDLILRRTDLGTFEVPKPATLDFCADLMAEFLGWDEQTKTENVRTLYAHYPHWVTGQPQQKAQVA